MAQVKNESRINLFKFTMEDYITLHYNNKEFTIKKDIIDNFTQLMNSNNLNDQFSKIYEEYAEANNLESQGNIQDAINITRFGINSKDLFLKQYKLGVYEELYQTKLKLCHLNSIERMIGKINKNINEALIDKGNKRQQVKYEYTNDSTLSDSELLDKDVYANNDESINKNESFKVATTYSTINKIKFEGSLGDKYDKNLLKLVKNQITIKQRNDDERRFYRQQEIERYKNPHLPWIYYSADGLDTAIVGPVLKRIPANSISKPREHILLKNERPGCITILCLARDAASRLPNFIGTRADVCDLIKDSCYINERVTDLQINTIVSGALDRLHYEIDPCVKYDVQNKVWIYLHGNRNLEYSAWNSHLKEIDSQLKFNASTNFEKLKEIVKQNKVEVFNSAFKFTGSFGNKLKLSEEENSNLTKNKGNKIRLQFENNFENNDDEESQSQSVINLSKGYKSIFINKKRFLSSE